MSPAVSNFLFEAANFLLLALGLGWVLFKPVRRALDAERAQRQKEIDEGNAQRAEAETLVEQARVARRDVERDLDERREQVIAAAKKEAAALLDEARAARQAEKAALEQELEARRSAEVVEVAETVGRVAADAVRELLAALPGPDLDRALLREACNRLQSLPAEARRSAVVESARALDGESKGALQAVLGASFEERVVASLGAGVRVTTSSGQVDTTALAIARRAARALASLGAEGARPEAEVGHG